MIKLAILGSTGSIGKKTIEIIKKNKSKYKVELLTTNTKTKELLKQSKQLKVKSLIVTDQQAYLNLKKKIKKKKALNYLITLII